MLVEDVAPVLFVLAEAVVLALCAKIAGRVTKVAIKVGFNMLITCFENV